METFEKGIKIMGETEPYESLSQSRDLMTMYSNQALNTPLLKREEEQILATKIQKWKNNRKAGQYTRKAGIAAREKMILSNLRLVVSVARKYKGRMDDIDLISEGNIGLATAADKYKPGIVAKNGNTVKFSTYAVWWIKQNILRAIANKGNLIRLPVHYQGKTKKVFEFIQKYKDQFDQDPSPDEIAIGLKMTLLQVENIVFTREGIVSLDKKIGEEEDQEIGDLIPDISFLSPDKEAEMNDRFKQLRKLMEERLTRREMDILKLRFGFGVRDKNTLEKIGKKYKVTRERIRQIEAIAFRKLRFTLQKRKKDLQHFFEEADAV
jgi:RNA polymerase primary sigma factor